MDMTSVIFHEGCWHAHQEHRGTHTPGFTMVGSFFALRGRPFSLPYESCISRPVRRYCSGNMSCRIVCSLRSFCATQSGAVNGDTKCEARTSIECILHRGKSSASMKFIFLWALQSKEGPTP
ncbi:unnamed protein product [Ectocarpus sp. 12 AP-2014]